MIFLGLWLVYELSFSFKSKQRKTFYYWLVLVFFTGYFAEVIGVKTSLVFGAYNYGPVLQPQLLGVPLAIGFAWITMTLGAGSIVSLGFRNRPARQHALKALLVGLIMVIFDLFMEPAAVQLNYWSWLKGQIPFQNYVAWFVLGSGLAYIGFRQSLFTHKHASLAVHMYLAQIFYFIMVYFK